MWLSFVAQVLGTFVVTAPSLFAGWLGAAEVLKLPHPQTYGGRPMFIVYFCCPALSAAAALALTIGGASFGAAWWQILAAGVGCGFTSGVLLEVFVK